MKGRKIKNLTREDITIVDYKNLLVKNSASAIYYASPLFLFSSLLFLVHVPCSRLVLAPCVPCSGYAALEKAKLFSKTTSKTKGV